MTKKAVESILRLDVAHDVEIVIVDNASPDGSGAVLAGEYAHDGRINVIRLRSNLGFAGGNNAGYSFLREKGSADFIVVMNNDVLIEQTDFVSEMEKIYSRTPFAVLGPDILAVKTCLHQNPAHGTIFSLDEVRKLRTELERRDRCFFYSYWTFRIKCILGLANPVQPRNSSQWEMPSVETVLHGACYIFSRDFMAVRELAFNPATFLYMEEDILAKECSDAGLIMMYSPEIQVLHLEDVSTSAAWKTEYHRSKMKNTQMLRSCRILEGLYEG